MTMRIGAVVAALCLSIPVAGRAAAAVDVDLLTEERRRGLGWSDGNASLRGAIGIRPAPAIRLDARATALRGGARHGGADAVFDVSAAWLHDAGAVRFDAGGVAHLFAGGAGRLDYLELQGGAQTLVGPLDIDLSASYAPRQRAIGGDMLHMRAGARLAVIGSPFTLSASIGRTSGATTDPLRAARLRPDDRYVDWQAGVEHVRERVTLGLVYGGTDIGRRGAPATAAFRRHTGDTVIGRVTIRL